MGYLFVLATIALTVYGQLVIKWQVQLAGPLPEDTPGRLRFLLGLLLNPWMWTVFAAAIGAMVAWMGAMTRFELSKAYPFMALNFVLVGLASVWLFEESLTPHKIAGVALIALGLIVMTRA